MCCVAICITHKDTIPHSIYYVIYLRHACGSGCYMKLFHLNWKDQLSQRNMNTQA